MKTKLKTLIDRASKKCNGDAGLSQATGLPVQNISNMRTGQRPVSPENVALFCAVLELQPDESREWLALSVIENPKNSSKLEVLKKAFFASAVFLILQMVFLGVAPENAQANQRVITPIVNASQHIHRGKDRLQSSHAPPTAPTTATRSKIGFVCRPPQELMILNGSCQCSEPRFQTTEELNPQPR